MTFAIELNGIPTKERILMRHHVVIIGIALAAPLLPIPAALAIPVSVDLGPTGIVHGARSDFSVTAPNVGFQGQNIALDFNFQNGEFIRFFTATSFFQMDAFFPINNAPIPQIFAGSGYLSDINGAALGPSVTLQAFPATNLVNQIGVDLVLRPLTSNAVPADAYGIHLDLTLPNSPGFGFVNSPAPGAITFFGDTFGIGPGVPANVIPEGGGTFVVFAVGLTALIAAKIWFRKSAVLTMTRRDHVNQHQPLEDYPTSCYGP
jgi:hypothetical protein